jgi:hypothetical protein
MPKYLHHETCTILHMLLPPLLPLKSCLSSCVSPVELTHRRGGGGGAKSDDGEKDVYVLLVVFRAFKAPNLRMAKNVEFIKMAGK